jgi:hypothetical protein
MPGDYVSLEVNRHEFILSEITGNYEPTANDPYRIITDNRIHTGV